MRTDVPGAAPQVPASRAGQHVSAGEDWWGGWGSNPRPADYESGKPMANCRGIDLHEREPDHRGPQELDRVSTMAVPREPQ